MNEGERVLQRTERAVERGYLDTTLAMQLDLEAQAAIAIELGRIADVLEREFGPSVPRHLTREGGLIGALDDPPEWDGMFTGDLAVWELVETPGTDGEVRAVDVGVIGDGGLLPRFFLPRLFPRGSFMHGDWNSIREGYLNED